MSLIVRPPLSGMIGPAGGGGGPSPLTFFTDLWAWYDITQETGFADEDRMGQATDWSGNGRHGTATGTTRPFYDTNQINTSMPAARFDQAQAFSLPSMTGLTAGHWFIVIKMKQDNSGTAGPNNGPWEMGGTTNESYFAWDNGPQIVETWGVSSGDKRFTKGGVQLNQWRGYEVQSETNNWRAYLDNVLLSSTATHTPSWQSNPRLGATRNGRAAGMWFVEAVICSSVQDATARAAWHDYINDKYGLTVP